MTFGTWLHTKLRGEQVGEDAYGNVYYKSKRMRGTRQERWVIYKGYPDASKVPAEWHGWLHYTFDELPTQATLPRKAWEKDHLPNMTGTIHAWRPKGSITRGGERQRAAGDYEAWRPE